MFWKTGNISRCKNAAAILFLALILVPVMVFAQERLISEIRIMGNEHISNDAILAAIALKPGMPASEANLQAAKKAIEGMGFFERVIVGTETTDAGIRIIFNVVENPVITRIDITGNTVVPTSKILSFMRVAPGSVLNTNTLLQQDIPSIERYYESQGYIAYVTEEVGIDPKTGVLRIPILEVRVQDIKVTGNVKTQTYVILREMKLKPGDVFNRNTLFADLRRIYDLNIFDREAAEPYRLDPGSSIGQVIITIPVKERKTGEVSVGVGYSTQNQLLGQVRVSEHNFKGKGQTISFMWEQSVNNGSSLEVGFFEPWLDDKHTSLNVNLYDKLVFRFAGDTFGTLTGSTNYDERRQGGSATFGRPLDDTSRGFFTLRYESVLPNAKNSLPFPLNESGNIASGTFRITNSIRDSEVDPTRGAYSSYAFELGRANFEAQGNVFTKLSGDFRWYSSPGQPRAEASFEPRPVFATRLKVGTYTGNVPFFEQYFLGGAESIRGFREDRFWGRYTMLASTEYRFPLGSSMTGVLFMDAGDAWGADEAYRTPDIFPELPQHGNFSPQFGYGVGIRVSTPIGPLRLDYGLSNEGSRAHFSIGHVF